MKNTSSIRIIAWGLSKITQYYNAPKPARLENRLLIFDKVIDGIRFGALNLY